MGDGHENEYVIFNEESSQELYRKWTRKFANRNVPINDQLSKEFLDLHTHTHKNASFKIANEICQQKNKINSRPCMLIE